MDFSSIDVEDLLRRLDISNARLTNSGTEVNFSCFGPEHSHGDESPSAYMNAETTAWFCHGCKRRGNAIGIVMAVQDVARATAESTLRDWYGIEFDEPIGGSMIAETEGRFREIPPPPAPITPPRSWLSAARIDWAVGPHETHERYLIDRGFSPAVLADWDIGYDFLSDRLTIPVFDINDQLVGIKARAWREDQKPKYLILGDRTGPRYGFNPYETSLVVFGLERARGCRRGVLCEGELNAIALSQLGVSRPIATGMSYFTERHAQLVVRELDELVIYYDRDQAGHDGVWGRIDSAGVFRPGAVQMLEPHMRVLVVEAPPDDPSKLLELGRGDEALQAIDDARSSLHAVIAFG